MEHTINPIDPPIAPRSIRWRQILAAILLCMPFCFTAIYKFVLPSFVDGGWSLEEIMILYSCLNAIPQLIGWMLLIGIAANRMTRVAVGIFAGWLVLGLLVSVLGHLGTIPNTVCNLIGVFDSLLLIYVFSILLRNNAIAESRRTWINLLAIGYLLVVLSNCAGIAQKAIPEGFVLQTEHLIFLSGGYRWYSAIMQLLLVIAYFKLTHSEAFAPTYDDSPAPHGAYSPATKYMAMPIICALIFFSLAWTLYHFADVLV